MTYTIIDVIKDELKGTAQYVTKEEKLRRLNICQTCTHLTKVTRQCSLCGCFVDAKCKYKEAECGDGKW
jgi:hypothetical protein